MACSFACGEMIAVDGACSHRTTHPAAYSPPERPELILEEVERNIRIPVDAFGPCSRRLWSLSDAHEPAHVRSRLKLCLEGFGLLLTPAVHKTIIGYRPWKVGMRLRHPEAKCIMQEEIG